MRWAVLPNRVPRTFDPSARPFPYVIDITNAEIGLPRDLRDSLGKFVLGRSLRAEASFPTVQIRTPAQRDPPPERRP